LLNLRNLLDTLFAMQKACLLLESDQKFHGLCPEWQTGVISGEVVFTTGMTGYTESLTDPSYNKQLLVFTYPLIGNYGVCRQEDWESRKIWAKGVIINEVCLQASHPTARSSFLQWLEEQNVALITDIDTRELTKTIREQGAPLGKIICKDSSETSFFDTNAIDLVKDVSIQEVKKFGDGPWKVIVVDCGTKTNILRCLQRYDLSIIQVPYDHDYSDEDFDGVFLSNGPGNPQMCQATISILKKAMKKKKPIFGICLGTQIMALAAGASTYKLPFGHRSHNQPCIDLKTQRCYITSQNHGYAVSEGTLPDDWEVTFRNLNDNSIEGIAHKRDPFFAFQFHPEAAPGPTDTHYAFDIFYKMITEGR